MDTKLPTKVPVPLKRQLNSNYWGQKNQFDHLNKIIQETVIRTNAEIGKPSLKFSANFRTGRFNSDFGSPFEKFLTFKFGIHRKITDLLKGRIYR